MKIQIRLQEESEGILYENVSTAYTKGPLYCIRLEDGSTEKFPLVNIFSIKEENGIDES